MKQERTISFYDGHFSAFYSEQSVRVKNKIKFVFSIIRTVERVPEKFLKHLSGTDGLYEIRVACAGNIFRIFCCFDKANLVVLFNAFQKKTQETPEQEIRLAQKLRKEYFQQKHHEK
ncbi:MAG: Phage derived protein Gp49-like [Sediminibacterium sp.]|nr:Phage derived protein Gp49-like [Sediminibacterium sp.]